MSQSHPAVLTQTESDPGGVAVRVRQLTKHFGAGDQRVQALAGINLDIDAGQMSLIVGPSGCGKTTLLSVIAGILDADEGEVSIFGSDITRDHPTIHPSPSPLDGSPTLLVAALRPDVAILHVQP